MKKHCTVLSIIFLINLICFSTVYSQVFPKEKKGKWALVEKRKKLTEYQYDEIENYYKDYFAVRKGHKWGVLNNKGELTVPLVYDAIQNDDLGIFIIVQNDQKGVIDTSNQVLVEIKYEDVDYFGKDSIALVQEKGRWLYLKNNQGFDNGDIIFKNPDREALFVACDNCSIEEAEKQSQDAIIQFTIKNLKYPEKASRNGIEGVIIIKFIVDEGGNIVNPTIFRDIGGDCGLAGMDVVSLMPKWAEAAIKNGQKVKSEVVFPIRFK